MKILGFIFAITGIINLIIGYYVAIDKKKTSKVTQVINYIIIAILFFGHAINTFLK